MIAAFMKAGYLYPENIIGITPTNNANRGGDIREWLKETPGDHTICILDDDSDMEEFLPFLVKTKLFGEALSESETSLVISMLNEK
jgi:hypothetical protein